MKTAAYLVVGIVLLEWADLAAGGALFVGGGGSPNYPTIQSAINAAAGSDEIRVAPGIYYEAISFSGKAVRLYSANGPSVTTINGNGAYHVVQCVSGEGPSTILEGFTITGGNANGTGGEQP